MSSNQRTLGAVLVLVGIAALLGSSTAYAGTSGRDRRVPARRRGGVAPHASTPGTSTVIDGVTYILPSPSQRRTWQEWERSSAAEAHGIDNRVRDPAHQQNIIYLSTFLDALEEQAGAPVRITSGYRVPELNVLLEGSASDSRHMSGEAVDFSIPDRFGTSYDLAKFVHGTGYPFQKIGVYPGEARVHLQYTPATAPEENARRYVYYSTGGPVSFRV